MVRKNRLCVNTEKSKLIIFQFFQSRCNVENLKFSINNATIIPVQEYRCLRVRLDSRLSFSPHVDSIINKLRYITASLAKLRESHLPSPIILNFYKSLFLPHITFAIVVYGLTYKYTLNKLQVIQNIALRAVFGIDRRLSVRYIFRRYELLSVSQLYQFELGKLPYKSFHNLLLSCHTRTYTRNDASRIRNSRPLKIPLIRSEVRKEGIDMAVGPLWNSMDVSLSMSPTLCSFKHRWKDLLLCTDDEEGY